MGELTVLRSGIGWERDVTVRSDDRGIKGDVTTSNIHLVGADVLGKMFIIYYIK